MSYLKEMLGARELLFNLTRREVSGKYRRTSLGQLWSLANPIAAIIIYTFIFSLIFQINAPIGSQSGLNNYALFLVSGLLPWLFFQRVTAQGIESLVNNAGLIQKVYFPRLVLPLSVVGGVLFTWAFEMAVLIVALLIVGAWGLLPFLPLVLLAMGLLAFFAAGLATFLAVINVYFRDTSHLVTVVLQFWFYLTPILYPISLVESQSARYGGLGGTQITLLDLYRLNPIEPFISIFRSLLYDNALPAQGAVISAGLWTLIMVGAGFVVFWRNEKLLAERL
jgi:lipopolysaccharide transport system permease protein